ncbi:hypothetical protein CW749_23815 [Vibrio sp. vnigr-6D03]|uniref:hypothetical protein n=1 Tax=Vibrio sp. vnigr-6D03 TaxID=2058088 RepID=UPI000C3379CA|nr:hypothetical protein [Vibrio sp. vnigr-6D03]PKF77040.1 hypothetical protein CW749_23815 [Vibrio sp. vnigr-6D03]
MKIKNTLMVSALVACGMTAYQASATDLYAGAYKVNTAMEESIDEMIMAKLQASFFSSAALYMDVLSVNSHKATPIELKKQLEVAYKETKYTDEQRQDLADAFNEVGLVIDYLADNEDTKRIVNETLTFCSAQGVEAKNWPGIDDIVAKYGASAKYDFDSVIVDVIHAPVSGDDCGQASSWVGNLKKSGSEADYKSLPSNIIAYSPEVGNSQGELVYIFENSIHEESGFKANYETFTFYQSNSEGVPDDGIFRRYRVSDEVNGSINEFTSNVSCKQCGSDSESFKIEAKRTFDGVLEYSAGTAIENAGKLVPGFISETDKVHLVEYRVSGATIDLFDTDNGIVVGRNASISPTDINGIKLMNLIGQFGLNDVLNVSGLYNPTSFIISPDFGSFTITDSSDSNNHKVHTESNITDEEEKKTLRAINDLVLSDVAYKQNDVDSKAWESIK